MGWMNLRQLEVFYAIMSTGAVTAAARRLNVTQPAISNTLRHMEQQLGFALFERKGGRLHPTPEATDLMPDVNEIFERLDRLDRVVQDMRDGKAGHLIIATTPTLVNVLIPRAVAVLRDRNPDLRISVLSLPTALAVDRIARREADIGLIYAPADNPGVDAEDLITTEIALAVPKTHPMAARSDINIADVADQTFISVGPHTRLGRLIDAEFRRAGAPPPKIEIDAGSSVAACLMVGEGTGIALVDCATTLSGKFSELAFRSFRPSMKVTVQLILPRARLRSKLVAHLAEQLRTTFAP